MNLMKRMAKLIQQDMKKEAEFGTLSDWQNLGKNYDLPVIYSTDSTEAKKIFLFKYDFIDQEIIKAGGEPMEGQSPISAWLEYDGVNHNIVCESNMTLMEKDNPEYWKEMANIVCESIEQSGIGDQIAEAIEDYSKKLEKRLNQYGV